MGLNKKGNSFSTSSPKSSGFEASNPSWKTLAEGSIPGNFMLTADVEADGEEISAAPEIAGYDIYRNGVLLAADVKELKYTDTVEDLGTYNYGVVAKGKDGRLSPAKEIDVTYTLPAAYEAPVILSSTIDENNKLDLTYSAEAIELKHYDAAAYMAGFSDGKLQRVQFITHTASQFFLGKLGTVKQVGHLLGKAWRRAVVVGKVKMSHSVVKSHTRNGAAVVIGCLCTEILPESKAYLGQQHTAVSATAIGVINGIISAWRSYILFHNQYNI